MNYEPGDPDYTKDETATRTYTFDGQDVTITCTDPYGFWKVNMGKKKVPKELSGQFTSAFDATKAIDSYFNKLALLKQSAA